MSLATKRVVQDHTRHELHQAYLGSRVDVLHFTPGSCVGGCVWKREAWGIGLQLVKGPPGRLACASTYNVQDTTQKDKTMIGSVCNKTAIAAKCAAACAIAAIVIRIQRANVHKEAHLWCSSLEMSWHRSGSAQKPLGMRSKIRLLHQP